MWYIYIMEYYSAEKKQKQTNKQKNDILKFAGKWMELEKKNIPSEISQVRIDKHGMYSLISGY